ncbi:MAG: DUF4037 domain-containing protein [Opitutaceae bacterium]|nr:DUF4037 domain-containing protein [Opitutaceae bacterium]
MLDALQTPLKWLVHPAPPVLVALGDECPLIWHGSRARRITDEVADVDLWMVVDDDQLKMVEREAGTNFFVMKVKGVEGHVNLVTADHLVSAFSPVDMATLFELRNCQIVRDRDGFATELRNRSLAAMPDRIREAWFIHHYVRMRSEHRAADNPMFRGDAVAVLFGVSKTLEQALRAAMVLDGKPYPYHKWLHASAKLTPTGRIVAAMTDQAISLMGDGDLRRVGDERDNPLSLKLREIRAVLIEAAKAKGVDGPWPEKWWYHIDSSQRSILEEGWLA